MAITKISKKAFAIMAICSKTKKYFGITVDPKGRNDYSFIWAFPLDKRSAHKEGFDGHHVNGSISFDENYNGCPHCGEKNFFICGSCGTLACYSGRSNRVRCPHCNQELLLEESSNFDLSGGSY